MRNETLNLKLVLKLGKVLLLAFGCINDLNAAESQKSLDSLILQKKNLAKTLEQSNEKLAFSIQQMIVVNKLPGMVLAIMHKDELKVHRAFGYADRENKTLMHKDNVFRLYSMTKPITAAATLKLLDEKNIAISTPLQQFFPKFTQQLPIPISSLLNHTSGMSYGFKINRIAGWQYLFSGISSSETLDEFMSTLADLPLLSDPGNRWRYSFSSDVQGALIQKISGFSIEHYFSKALFEPLQMTNTGFYVPSEALSNVVPMYSNDWFSDEPKRLDIEPELSDVNTVQSGGSGLLSTASDYIKFLHLLQNPQQYSAIINTQLIESMLSNQLKRGVKGVPERLYTNSGFGYGIGVKLKDETYLSKGSVYWAGKGGTIFWVDRKNELAVVAMMQMEKGNRDLEKNLVPMVYEWLNTL